MVRTPVMGQQPTPINRLAQLRKQIDAKNAYKPPAAPPTETPPSFNTTTPVVTAPGSTTGIVNRVNTPGVSAGGRITGPGVKHNDPSGAMQSDPAMQPGPPAEQPKDHNTAEDDFIDSLINGAGGNPEQEAFIRQLFEEQSGQDLIDARARGGRFGAMGAQGAIEGDVRRKDSQAAQQAIFDQRQQAIQNALAGLTGEATIEQTRANDAILRQILGLAQDDGATEPAPETGPTGDNANPAHTLNGGSGPHIKTKEPFLDAIFNGASDIVHGHGDTNNSEVHAVNSTGGQAEGTDPNHPHHVKKIPSDAEPVPGYPGVWHIGHQYYVVG